MGASARAHKRARSPTSESETRVSSHEAFVTRNASPLCWKLAELPPGGSGEHGSLRAARFECKLDIEGLRLCTLPDVAIVACDVHAALPGHISTVALYEILAL